ncbi:MAG: hypothetical protein AAGA56_17760, partial [Myxococcota bacterium]
MRTEVCGTCGGAIGEDPIVGRHLAICRNCGVRLGHAMHARTAAFFAVWPFLDEPDDEGEPAPRVRPADGTSVELR